MITPPSTPRTLTTRTYFLLAQTCLLTLSCGDKDKSPSTSSDDENTSVASYEEGEKVIVATADINKEEEERPFRRKPQKAPTLGTAKIFTVNEKNLEVKTEYCTVRLDPTVVDADTKLSIRNGKSNGDLYERDKLFAVCTNRI